MNSVGDFEDMLELLEKHQVRYVIIGGLAFIYHAKPRYTKDMDLWVDPSEENLARANLALAEFGSPDLLSRNPEEVLQIGVAPDRIDILEKIEGVDFETAWGKRIRDRYGDVLVNWIDIDSLILAKQGIDNPRHQEDVRVLLQTRELRNRRP